MVNIQPRGGAAFDLSIQGKEAARSSQRRGSGENDLNGTIMNDLGVLKVPIPSRPAIQWRLPCR